MAGREIPHPPVAERQHAEFHVGFIWVALATAIFAGFGIGSHLAFVIGFGFPLRASFPAMVQAHGHAQLVGWAGLFVVGTSLHFIPRLASVPLTRPRWIGAILWMMTAGLFIAETSNVSEIVGCATQVAEP